MAKKKTANRKRAAKIGSVKGAKKQDAAKPKKTVTKARSVPKNGTAAKQKKTRLQKRAKTPRKVVPTTPVVDYDRARLVLDKYGDQLRTLGGKVTGVSIGPRFKNGVLLEDKQDEMVIRLQVATKRDKQWLKNNADKIGYQRDYDGVDTDIVVWNFKTSSTAC